MKLSLPTVTLMCIDCVDPVGASKVLEICKSKVDFGAVKLLTSEQIDYEHRVECIPLRSLIMYSIFMLTKAYHYIDTPHVLIVQRDGWILNQDSWRDEWLSYDYIGPMFMQNDKVGSGGFSLRSQKIMRYAAKMCPYWNGDEQSANEIQYRIGCYEDGILSRMNNVAPPSEAMIFAQGGNRNPAYFCDKPFGFHRTWQQIDFNTGLVDSSDIGRDITQRYEYAYG